MKRNRIGAINNESEHDFKRGTDSTLKCHVCFNKWPCTDGLVSKRHTCAKCGIHVHSSCRVIAQRGLNCQDRDLEDTEVRFKRLEQHSSGLIKVIFLQIYDIPVVSGTILYAVCRSSLVGKEVIIQSGPVVVSDNGEVVWDNTLSNLSSIDDTFRYDKASNDNIIENEYVTIEVWKSFMAIFDSKVASCTFCILPILQFNRIEIERWFPLTGNDGKPFGNILLKFYCQPSNSIDDPSTDRLELTGLSHEESLNESNLENNIELTSHSSDGSLDEIRAALSDEDEQRDPKRVQTPIRFEELTHDLTGDNAVQPNIQSPGDDINYDTIMPTNDSEDLQTFYESRSRGSSASTPFRQLLENTETISKVSSDIPAVTPKKELIREPKKSIESNIRNYAQSISDMAYGFVDYMMKQTNVDDSVKEISSSYVGHIHVNLISAYKYDVQDPGDGNYYVAATVNDSHHQELKSKIVYNSATPIFNSKWVFTVPYFRSNLKLTLIDASNSDRRVGESVVSIYSLVQQQADSYFDEDLKLSLEAPRNIHIHDLTDKTKNIGYFKCKIDFKEDIQGLYMSYNPRVAATGPPEPLSVERLTIHIARFQAIVDLVCNLMTEYQKVVEWEDPFITFVSVTVFVYCCLRINAEYGLCCPVFFAIFFLSTSYMRRRSGAFKLKFIAPKKKASNVVDDDGFYQPYAVVRLSVLGFKRIDQSTSQSSLSRNNDVNGISSISGYFTGSTSTKPSSNVNALSKAAVRVSYIAMNSLPSNLSLFQQSGRNISEGALSSQDLFAPKEFFIGCFKTFSQDLKDASSNISKLMYSWKIPGVIGLIGSGDDDLVHDVGVFHNVYEPWSLQNSESENSSRRPSFSYTSKYNKQSDVNTDHLVASEIDFHMKEICLVYPILQPVTYVVKQTVNTQQSGKPDPVIHKLSLDLTDLVSKGSKDDLTKDVLFDDEVDYSSQQTEQQLENKLSNKVAKLIPWDKNDGYLKVMIYSDDMNGSLQEQPIGSVKVMIKDLLSKPSNEYFEYSNQITSKIVADKCDIAYNGLQPEVIRWYNIVGDQRSSPLSTPTQGNDDFWAGDDYRADYSHRGQTNSTPMQVRLRIQLDIKSGPKEPTPQDKEASRALNQLMYRQNTEKNTSSTITALWNMRDHITYVQNLMSWILDLIESFKNIFNWTSPAKTSLLYLSLIVLWLTSLVIPGRYLILLVGLHQFFYKFLPDPDGRQFLQRLHNLLQSLPNDDDLNQYYHQDRVDYAEKQRLESETRLKKASLNLVLPCYWEGKVLMKLSFSVMTTLLHSGHINTASSTGGQNVWEESYLVLQRNRLVWWKSERDIYNVQKHCSGQLLLCSSGSSMGGVSGITQTSPVDIKEMKDSKRLIAIFGSDEHGSPLKCTIFFSDVTACQEFHHHVSSFQQ